jgi:signal peptidase I
VNRSEHFSFEESPEVLQPWGAREEPVSTDGELAVPVPITCTTAVPVPITCTTAVQRRIAEREASLQLDRLDQFAEEAGLSSYAATRRVTAGFSNSIRPGRPSVPGQRLRIVLAGWIFAARAPLRVAFAGLAVYLFAFSLSVVRGTSMAPGIHDGDRILIDQVSYILGDVQRGDIVVLRYPLDPSLDYIKRVVGLPGDEIVMAGGSLWVNGRHISEAYLGEVDLYTHAFVRVRPGHFFVLGDNRLHSSDSREFGQVHEDLLRGKVELCLWPPTRMGWLR